MLGWLLASWLNLTGYRTIGMAVAVMAVGACGIWFGGNWIGDHPRWTALGIMFIGGLQLWLRFQTKGPVGWGGDMLARLLGKSPNL